MPFALVLIATVVGIDVLYLRNRSWQLRLVVNVTCFALRWGGRPRPRTGPPAGPAAARRPLHEACKAGRRPAPVNCKVGHRPALLKRKAGLKPVPLPFPSPPTYPKMPQFHTLRREQRIPRPIDQVFTFFSDAHNLEELTPPWLRFHVLSPRGIAIRKNTELNYRLRLHGISISWKTEIRIWDPPHRFVDLQRKGPYRLWHHTHLFEPFNGGTKMTDVVRYRLPFGILGRLAQAMFVDRDVEKIFDYRYEKIAALFGQHSDIDNNAPRLF